MRLPWTQESLNMLMISISKDCTLVDDRSWWTLCASHLWMATLACYRCVNWPLWLLDARWNFFSVNPLYVLKLNWAKVHMMKQRHRQQKATAHHSIMPCVFVVKGIRVQDPCRPPKVESMWKASSLVMIFVKRYHNAGTSMPWYSLQSCSEPHHGYLSLWVLGTPFLN